MKRALVVLGLLAFCSGAVLAQQISYGPAAVPVILPDRDDVCQYGFQDYMPSSGWTLGLGQQLGISCPGPMNITRVGFFCEFVVIPGSLDIVIYDDGVEISRTMVQPVQGTQEYDVGPANVTGVACIMLCEVGGFWAVTGEDNQSPPYGNCYWSNACQCTNAFTDNNLTIWAVYGGPTPATDVTWGYLRNLFR